MYNPNPNPKPDPDPNPNPNPNQAPIAPRVIFKEAAAAWRTSEQNPRVQQDRRAAEEAEARLVEDSKTWGAPGLALITEHNKKLFIQEFIGAGALEGGRTGAGTEQVRLLEDHYEGKGYERWDGHVYEYNPQGKNFWLERLPGKVIKDAEEMIPERHVSDEHMGEYSEWTYFTIDSTSLRARFQELNIVKLKCTKLALNPETNAHHKISFDGTAAHGLGIVVGHACRLHAEPAMMAPERC